MFEGMKIQAILKDGWLSIKSDCVVDIVHRTWRTCDYNCSMSENINIKFFITEEGKLKKADQQKWTRVRFSEETSEIEYPGVMVGENENFHFKLIKFLLIDVPGTRLDVCYKDTCFFSILCVDKLNHYESIEIDFSVEK